MKIRNNLNTIYPIKSPPVQVIRQRQPNTFDTVSFKGLMPDKDKDQLKMCVYDLDDTLLKGSQATRNKVLDFSKDKVLIYSSGRPLSEVQSFIDSGILVMPDYYVGSNGENIYETKNGKLKEIKNWSDNLAKDFDKDKIRQFMLEIAKANMFEKTVFAAIPEDEIPEGQKEFRGSKITEFELYGSPLNINFMVAPGMSKKVKSQIEKKLKENGIKAEIMPQHFDKGMIQNAEKFFSGQILEDMKKHLKPRLNEEGGLDTVVISAKTNKGKATEYLRKQLGIKRHEVFAAGDAENDSSHTNKGYRFGMVANATQGLKDFAKNCAGIIKAFKSGVEGVWEILKP